MPTATTINPDRRPCVCPRATGEQLIALAYRTMGGDTLVGGRAAFSHKGSPAAVDTNGVVKGEVYDAGWWFQKREDAYAFIKRYGGVAE